MHKPEGLEQLFSIAERASEVDRLFENVGQIFMKITSGRAAPIKKTVHKCRKSWILDCLVVSEKFESLLMTLASIHNKCTLSKQFWSNILSNSFLGGEILTFSAVLSGLSSLWKVLLE